MGKGELYYVSEDEIIQKILRPVGKQVSFNYPLGEGNKKGILRDRAVVKSNPSGKNVQYWDVMDLIEFPNKNETEWIRIGYYRQIGNKIRWASQTTITEPIDIWKKILIQSAREKNWFRDLLIEVAEEITK